MTIKLSKVFDYFLKAFLFVSVIFYLPINAKGMSMDDAIQIGYMNQELFFRYGTLCLFALSCTIESMRKLVFSSWPVLIIFLIITSLLFGFGVEFRSGILNMSIALLFYKIVFEYVDTNELKKFAHWFGLLLLLNFVWCGLQWFGHDMIFSNLDKAVVGKIETLVGFMKLKVHLGVLAAVLLPVVLFYAPLFSIFTIPLLFFSQSSAAAFAAVVAVMIICWHRMNRTLFFFISTFIIIFGLWFILHDLHGSNFSARFDCWEKTIAISMKGLAFIGAGIGRFHALNLTTNQPNGNFILWPWVHNEFIQAFYEFGIIGFSLILGYILSINKKAQQVVKDKTVVVLYASFVSIIIVSFVHFPFHLGRFVPIMLFMMACLHSRIEDLKNA